MKIRTILTLLALLAVLAIVLGGGSYYYSLQRSAYEMAYNRAAQQTETIRNQVSSFLSENLKPVRALARIPEIRRAVAYPDDQNLHEANRILDQFKDSLDVEVCYLMDARGLTIASSNRGDADSFVGQNFSFRPYFADAAVGRPGTYLALGATSNRRGAYFSFPVFGFSDEIKGVAVVKASIRVMEENIIQTKDGLTLLVGPQGIVFSANREDWVFGTVYRISEQDRAELAASRQFGKGPWSWVGLEPSGENTVKDKDGNDYVINALNIDRYAGWQVVHLVNIRDISQTVLRPLVRSTTWLVFSLCLIAGLSVFYLFGKARREILNRRSAEEELRQAQEKLSHYSKDLEKQVLARTREVTGFLQYTPALVYMKDKEGRYILVNSRFEEIFGVSAAEVQGRTVYDLFPRESADQFRRNDLIVLESRQSFQDEETVLIRGEVRTMLSVRFPILDESGEVNRLCGISVDVTELKAAQEKLRRLSGGIIANQEKERMAIARELHDELGQVLTAMRMDAVWLCRRLEETDVKASERAAAIRDLIDTTITDVRGIARRLRPAVLDDLGLVDALEWHTADFEKRTGIVAIFRDQGVPPVDAVLSIAVYRVAQEALTNAARHSDATHVEVALAADERDLLLTVSDNGRGFDPDLVSEERQFGLAGMRERAYLVSGTLNILSQPGQGAQVRFQVPLHRYGGDE